MIKLLRNQKGRTVSFLLTLLICSSSAQAALVPVGAGGYESAQPANTQGPSDANGNTVTPRVSSSFSLPPNTNDWWSSLIWKYNPSQQWSENLFAHPFAFQATAQGLGMNYPTTAVLSPYVTTSTGYRSHEFHYNYQPELTVGVVGMSSTDTKVDNYSDWTVTALWQGGGNTLKATIGHGLPFSYFTKTGGNIQVAITGTPTIWSNSNGTIGLTINGHNYGLFAPSGSTWTITPGNLQSNLNGKSYFSVAVLPDNSATTLEFYRQHAYAFVTNSTVTWSYNEPTSVLNATYTVQTTLMESGNQNVNNTLLALYRHQWLNTSAQLTAFTYVSPCGQMKVLNGNSFVTSSTFNGVVPELPLVATDGTDTFSKAQLYQYVDSIYKLSPLDRWNGITVADTYWTGKAIGKISRLIQVANQVQHTAARDLFLTELKARLEDWFNGQSPQLFYYNPTWKTLIGYPASYGSDTQLNDHHFHYGYFIMGAATVAQYDSTWASQSNWGGMVEMLIKDVSNWDKTDQRFPFLRNFDAYAGHAWANGPALFAAGNNQESSSESKNFSTGLILWGSATNNTVLRDLGIYLYTTETSAIEQYWFDIDNAVFPAGYVEPTLGILWGNGGAYAIWWNGYVEELHGINFLPVTSGSISLGRNPNYLRTNQTFMESEGGSIITDWFDIHVAVRALYDPQTAILRFNANSNYTPEAGDSKAHTYMWIHNLNRLGLLDTTVTANVANYNVFNKNGVKSYVAYNPTKASITVNFSDGQTLVVPPGQIASNIGQSTNPIDSGFTQEADDAANGQINFLFTPNQTPTCVQLYYQVNQGAVKNIPLTQSNSAWQASVTGFSNNDNVSYYYVYILQGQKFQSASYNHVYTASSSNSSSGGEARFNYVISSLDSGVAQVLFTPTTTATSVIVHYIVNGGAQQNVVMTKGSPSWSYAISGLKNNDKISFSFTYQVAAGAFDSKWYSYQYQGSGSTPVNPYFTQTIQMQANNSALVTFTPAQPSTFVDIHYTVNSGGQQNVRMTLSGGKWTYTIANLKPGDVIKYTFTYVRGTAAYDSDSFQATYQAPSATK